jgi:CP family cyanate transporter-like MFS transporter
VTTLPRAGAVSALACLLIAANLRPALTSVGPVIADIRAATGLSAAAAGALTTLPLVAFTAASPFAPALARRLGTSHALLAAMGALVAGLVIRSTGSVEALLAGTVAAGVAIAVGNVLLPALIKQDFPHRIGAMTGLYSTTMTLVAALAAGVSVPLAAGADLGWRAALALWAIPAALALGVGALAWGRSVMADATPAPRRPRLLRSRLAWQVTGFMGLQSLLFYGLLTWMPTVLEQEGMSAVEAGWMLALLQGVSVVATLGVPVVAADRPDQRAAVLASASCCFAGLLGFWSLGASAAVVWIVPLGLGSGGLFSLALVFLSLRAPDARRTGELSSMAQSVGYLLAAVGPSGLGLLHDATGSWELPVQALLVIPIAALPLGLAAGRDVQV